MRALLTLAAGCLLCACTASEGAMDMVEEARARNDGPAIWVVEDADSTLYLYGSLHIVPVGLDWQRPDLWEAFERAGTVWLEVPDSDDARTRSDRLTRSRGYQPLGGSLSADFDDYERKLLEVAALESDIPLEVLDTLQPWLANQLLVLAAAEEAGLTASLSPESAIGSRARRTSKFVDYLDTVDSQIAMAADAPADEQRAALRQTLEGYNRIGQDLDDIAREWVEGDVETLEARLAGTIAGAPRERIMEARNARWAETFADWMDGSGTGLAVVGVGHLVGEDSLPEMLAERGLNVRRHFAYQGENVIRTIDLDIDGGS